ncbi:MFS multidrug transporter [Usnea florida]
MFGIVSTNEGIDLEQLHPAYKQRSRADSFGLNKYEWTGDTYEVWKRFISNNPSSPGVRNPYQPRPQSVRLSSSRRSSIATIDTGKPSLEIPIVPQRYSYHVPKEPTGDEVLVDFDGKDDPYRPINWPYRKKVITTILYGFTTCWVTFASAIYSAGVRQIAEDFNTTIPVSTAGISMVVFGFGLGPLLWAPLSEVYGRKTAVLAPYFIAAIFSFATGAAKDIQTVLLTRFCTGFFGSAPVTNTGGVLFDIWSPEQRGMAMVGYAIAVVGGPTIAPVIGGAITSSHLRWRWTEYLTGILMMAQLVLNVIILDESYGPALLVYKAQRLRHKTGNWALHAKHEEWNVSLKELADKYLVRPIQMFFTPICFLISLYSAFVYGILYANLGGFGIAFQEVRHWGPVTGNLPFLAMLMGMCVAGLMNIYNNKDYFKKFRANGNRSVPEARLPPMMIGGVLFAIGLFLFGWTSDPKVNYWPSIIGIFLTGVGFTAIFQSSLNYLVDTFTRYSASAVAANMFLRAMFAGAFPLFVGPMYHNIGIGWGNTIFGCVAVILVPVPFLFSKWGRSIRANGEWSRPSV